MWRSLTLPRKMIKYHFLRGSTVGALHMKTK